MNTLYVIPIEPLEERYSADWLNWTNNFLENTDVKSLVIMPNEKTYGKIQTGQFLDSVQTNVFKSKQLQQIMDLFHNGQVKNGDVFWFHDLWFPGIEMLSYIRDTTDLNDIKIYGMLHAGTYDPNDFLTQCGMENWGRHFERMLLDIADGIFVATSYHKELIISKRAGSMEKKVRKKVLVVPFPMYHKTPLASDNYRERENIVVFPHRLAPEKGYKIWQDLKIAGKGMMNDWQFIATKEVCQNKKEYYDLLRRAKYAVSFAKQETWGIAMQEAVLCGCVPIVPSKLAYKEIYPSLFRYSCNNYVQNCINLIKRLQYEEGPEIISYELMCLRQNIIQRGNMAFETMFEIMMPKREKL